MNMAKISDVYSGIATNKVAKNHILRDARLGTRSEPETPNVGDAFRAVGAAAGYRDGIVNSRATIPFVDAVFTAWENRHEHLPS